MCAGRCDSPPIPPRTSGGSSSRVHRSCACSRPTTPMWKAAGGRSSASKPPWPRQPRTRNGGSTARTSLTSSGPPHVHWQPDPPLSCALLHERDPENIHRKQTTTTNPTTDYSSMLSMSCSFLVPSLTRHGLSSPGLFREALWHCPEPLRRLHDHFSAALAG